MTDDLADFSIHIIGLGLMGGSLALALRDHVRHITAEDLDPTVVQAALDQGVIDGVEGIAKADIIIVAIPADRIPALVTTIAPYLHSGTLVIDIGSTKSAICEALDQLPEGIQAVGGHPMCGLAENGFSNAIPTLYQGARFVLCETIHTRPTTRPIAEKLVRSCGAVPLWMDRDRHDFLTALTSHLPHLLSFALMRLASEIAGEDAELFALAAGGFDGATRLARTNEAMITGMFQTNANNIRELAARLNEHITKLDNLFNDPVALNNELGQIVQARRNYSTNYGERPIA